MANLATLIPPPVLPLCCYGKVGYKISW